MIFRNFLYQEWSPTFFSPWDCESLKYIPDWWRTVLNNCTQPNYFSFYFAFYFYLLTMHSFNVYIHMSQDFCIRYMLKHSSIGNQKKENGKFSALPVIYGLTMDLFVCLFQGQWGEIIWLGFTRIHSHRRFVEGELSKARKCEEFTQK